MYKLWLIIHTWHVGNICTSARDHPSPTGCEEKSTVSEFPVGSRSAGASCWGRAAPARYENRKCYNSFIEEKQLLISISPMLACGLRNPSGVKWNPHLPYLCPKHTYSAHRGCLDSVCYEYTVRLLHRFAHHKQYLHYGICLAKHSSYLWNEQGCFLTVSRAALPRAMCRQAVVTDALQK